MFVHNIKYQFAIKIKHSKVKHLYNSHHCLFNYGPISQTQNTQGGHIMRSLQRWKSMTRTASRTVAGPVFAKNHLYTISVVAFIKMQHLYFSKFLWLRVSTLSLRHVKKEIGKEKEKEKRKT